MTKKRGRGRRRNGDGCARLRDGRYYIRYTDEHGKQVERVTEATSLRDAERIYLRKALDVVERRKAGALLFTMADLCAYHRRERVAMEESTTELDKRWKSLADFFGPVEVNSVSSALIAEYRERRAASVSKSTINRELACIRHLLRVGAGATPPIVSRDCIPTIKLADERDRVRVVFIDDDVWPIIHANLADHLKALFTVALWIGWRRGELLGLQRSQVDLKLGTIRLRPGTTKNKEGRLVYLPAEALEALREQEKDTRALERKTQRVIPWVFHFRGARIASYATGWRAALRRAGFERGSYRPHDFRRTAARSYIRAGVAETVAMKITGHKTREVFRRYNITDEPDLAAAAERVTIARAQRNKGKKKGETSK